MGAALEFLTLYQAEGKDLFRTHNYKRQVLGPLLHPELKAQSKEWLLAGERPQKKLKRECSSEKFCDYLLWCAGECPYRFYAPQNQSDICTCVRHPFEAMASRTKGMGNCRTMSYTDTTMPTCGQPPLPRFFFEIFSGRSFLIHHLRLT